MSTIQAILDASLPSRAIKNEEMHNPALDLEGEVAEGELSIAQLIALLSDSPIAASILYRAAGTTKLLIEFMSILPLRPSLALAQMQASIRER